MHELHLLQIHSKLRTVPCIRSARIVLLVMTLALTVGCTTPAGPIGSEGFNPEFPQSVKSGEEILFYGRSEFLKGTFAEDELARQRATEGVLVLTDKRIIFARWNDTIERYKTSYWQHYFDSWKLKKHNSALLQYVAITNRNGSKNTFFLTRENIEKAYAIIANKGSMQGQQENHQGIQPRLYQEKE